MKNTIIILAFLALAAILLTGAKPLSETFFNQDCDGTVCTIEAKLKGDANTCIYWEPGEYSEYEFYLGFYGELAGDPDLLGFCLANYGDRNE